MSNKYLKYAIVAGLFVVPFVPFIVSTSLFFPFITGKSLIFRLIVEIILACYIVLALRDESVRPRFSWILGTLTIFLLCLGLSDIFAVNPFKAFWSNYERMEGYITLLHLGAYFLVLSSIFKTQQIWNRLLVTSLGASAIMSIYAFFQLAGKITINQGGVRVDGTLGNAAYLAIYTVFHIFIAALLFVRFKDKSKRILIAVAALMNLVVLYFTATRGAILGFLGGVFLTLIFLLYKSEKGHIVKKVSIGGIVGLIIFSGLFFAIKDMDFVKESPVLSRFSSLSFSEIKTQGRYYVWPMAWQGFLEKPILGWGQEGFNFVFNKYYDPRMYNQEPWFDRAHSTPLDWLIAGGALGLLSYLSIFIALIFYLFRSSKDDFSWNEKGVMLGLVSAYVFNNIFVFDQISSYILFFTVLAYVHSHASETNFILWEKFSSKMAKILQGDKAKPVTEALVLIAAVAVVYFAVYAPWKQNKDLLAVLRLNNEGKVGEIENYTKPLRDGVGFSESLEHISQTSMALAASPNASTEFKQALFNAVDQAFSKKISQTPEDVRYRLFYALFLSRYGWYGRALEQLDEAKKFSPRKQQIYFEIASNALFDGKIDKAVEAAKTSYELETSNPEARIVYGLVLTAAGDTGAKEILQSLPESKIIFDDRYITVLLAARRYDDIINVAKKRIELDPTNLQHYITLAAAYLQSNRRVEAVQTLEELIKIEPSFKEKGEYYIKEIQAGRNP